MIKIKTITETKEVALIDNIICNMCGKPCPNPLADEAELGGQWECATLDAHWGYGSPRDGCVDESHICPSCYEKIIDGFVIKDVCTNGYDAQWEEEDPPQSHERMERMLTEPSILEEDD